MNRVMSAGVYLDVSRVFKVLDRALDRGIASPSVLVRSRPLSGMEYAKNRAKHGRDCPTFIFSYTDPVDPRPKEFVIEDGSLDGSTGGDFVGTFNRAGTFAGPYGYLNNEEKDVIRQFAKSPIGRMMKHGQDWGVCSLCKTVLGSRGTDAVRGVHDSCLRGYGLKIGL